MIPAKETNQHEYNIAGWPGGDKKQMCDPLNEQQAVETEVWALVASVDTYCNLSTAESVLQSASKEMKPIEF